MPTRQSVPTSTVALHTALAALWLVLAAVISLFTMHMSIGAARTGDAELADAANGLGRLAATLADRGASGADITAAVQAAARAHGVTVTVQPFPLRPPFPEAPRPGEVPGPPFGIMMPDANFGDDPLHPPTVMLHVAGVMMQIELTDSPWVRVQRNYVIAMVLLLLVALGVTWAVNQRALRRATAPVATIAGALDRLAAGEYSRLAMLDHDDDQSGIVEAYNAAADELASSIRLRAEAESNLRQFVADAGHELRTPLTVIMGFVDVLRQGAIAEQALAQRILESVAGEGERMRSLISRMLTLARLDAVAPERQESVSLAQIAADTVESFRPIAGPTALAVAAEPDVTVVGTASDVREVVGILVDNALKYAPGSHVRITTERSGRYGVLTVSDDGPGMAPEMRGRAFDRFARGDDRGSIPGSGLGLAIVKRIALRAGGEVDLESTLGQGTTVIVRFPLAPA